MHLDGNPPESSCPSRSSWHIFLRKLGWAITAAIVPEYVLSVAITEFMGARALAKLRNSLVVEGGGKEISAETHNSSCATTKFPDVEEQWTVEHGFFACMGGFSL